MTKEPNQGDDHSRGRLILRWIGGHLRVFRIRDFADANTRGERYE